jgi:hypothetical protein
MNCAVAGMIRHATLKNTMKTPERNAIDSATVEIQRAGLSPATVATIRVALAIAAARADKRQAKREMRKATATILARP